MTIIFHTTDGNEWNVEDVENEREYYEDLLSQLNDYGQFLEFEEGGEIVALRKSSVYALELKLDG